MNSDSANIVILLGIFLPVVVFAQPQLSSSIGSLELSGEQCPGTLTLTCDARNLETIDTINWFVGGERFFLFDANSDSTPFTGTTTRPDILNATVQLTSVTISGNQSSFINFTLSASVSNFVLLQGQNISCGNLGSEGRSSSFRIREFTLRNESTLFPYQDPGEIEVIRILPGNEEMLRIRWNISDSQCEGTVFNFRVYLRYSTTSDRRTVHCSSVCEVFFNLSSAVYQYVVDVWVINSQGDLVRQLSTINSTDEITFNHSIEHTTCETTFMCISAVDGECVFDIIRNDATEHRQRGAVNSSVTFSNLMSNALYFYRINFTSLQPIQIIENKNFTTNEDIGSDVAAVIGVGVIVFVLGLTEHLMVVCVLLVYVNKKKRGVEVCWKRLITISIIMAFVMYITLAIVWIVAFVTYTQVSCGTLRSTEIGIHIVALVLSIMITLISTLILAVVLIVCPCTKWNPEVAEYELQNNKCYDFTFGNGKLPDCKYMELKSICPNCNEEVSIWAKTHKRVYCDVCGEQMCTRCKNEVFLFRMMGFGRACKKCEALYLEQQKQFAESDDSVQEMSLLWREKCGEPCHRCNDQSTEMDFICYLCGKGMCSKYHTNSYTEEKDKRIEDSIITERIDDKTTFEMQVVTGDQVEASASKAEVASGDRKDKKKASATKAEVVSGNQVENKKASVSKAEVVTRDQDKVQKGDKTLQEKLGIKKKETLICRMCYTVYSRKQQYEELKKK